MKTYESLGDGLAAEESTDNMTLMELVNDALDRGDEKAFMELTESLTEMTEIYEREESGA